MRLNIGDPDKPAPVRKYALYAISREPVSNEKPQIVEIGNDLSRLTLKAERLNKSKHVHYWADKL